ncbi:DUF305 domain-containing protein [Pseudonocardia eucalypti]|uniref:DUF305 domain-containing protein n=1 Tax=Pseudonocardia eucalypti TaxID=648755 RepID=A0ABP9PW89_9PSEU|nr:uncharacterized protein (DUF305 family) [Pseudonocardia eucalypti]
MNSKLAALGILAGLVGAFLVGRVTAPDQDRPDPADVAFSQDMSTHHEQAVLMAGLADNRAGPAVKVLADAILGSQSQELGGMRGWLRLWGKPAESAHAEMGHSMPGMASPEELTNLWAKSGNEFDVLFLRLMIRHHQGGIAMARDAHPTLEVVRQAAAQMANAQTEEVGQMLALLRTYGAAPLPPP